jgi:hypothetical protein
VGSVDGGTISNSYATGDAIGGDFSSAGGLTGSFDGASIIDSYSTGAASGGFGGGVIGDDMTSQCNCFHHVYWDITTSGLGKSQGAGSVSNDPGLSGRTTTQLQFKLPKGLSAKVWAIDPSINNGFPYLIALKSSY